MKPLSNKSFKQVLFQGTPIKYSDRIELESIIDYDYINLAYDDRNDVFIEFNMDIECHSIPTDEQLEIAKEYLLNYEKL